MTGRERSLVWRVAAVIGLTLIKALGIVLSVISPPEQMNAQTMLPPESSSPRRHDYRP